MIQKTWDEERSAKRARGSSREPSPEISTWIELARYQIRMGNERNDTPVDLIAVDHWRKWCTGWKFSAMRNI